jgi:hypothetical protein
MHLRGPMNISQLAVYQLPGEIYASRKRATVPFYNRRRAMERRETTISESFYNTTVADDTPSHEESASTEPEHNILRRQAANWNRVAYYTSAAPAAATGLSFLGNLGDPQESGTFD